MAHVTATFYRFADWPRAADHRAAIEDTARAAGVLGTILLATEGVNGTIAGPEAGVHETLNAIRALPPFADLDARVAASPRDVFRRLKVRVKSEIVTFGQPNVDPTRDTGEYVAPESWHAVLDDPDAVVIDARNSYETAVGSFEGAVDPDTGSFRELARFLDDDPRVRAARTVAMYCTGGIRCEKATAYLRARSDQRVVQLHGGILNYLERIPSSDSRWRGACFVFDERVAVEHELGVADYTLCRGCRHPLADADRAMPEYVDGVSCPHCASETSSEQKAAYAERHRQVALADSRGERHIGR